MGTCQDKDAPRHYQWTPDGRTFVTATSRPQRTVDNGYKVWSYYGTLQYHQKYEKLFQVAIRPSIDGIYPDRPQSPQLTNRRGKELSAQRIEAGKPRAYVPPSLRKLGAGPSNIMKEKEEGPRTLKELETQILGTGVSGSSKYVVGQPKNFGQNAAKKKKKKEKKEKEKQAAEIAEAEEKEAKKQKAADVDTSDKTSVSKRVKALKKKQRQIEELKERKKKGETLDEGQLEKLEGEEALAKEIADLEKFL